MHSIREPFLIFPQLDPHRKWFKAARKDENRTYQKALMFIEDKTVYQVTDPAQVKVQNQDHTPPLRFIVSPSRSHLFPLSTRLYL
jgi:hypothetical protein